jgi:serpin B
MKLKSILPCCLSLVLLAGCSKDPVTVNSSNGGNPDLPFAVAKSASVQRDTAPVAATLMDAQVESNNRFAVAMYMHIIKGDSNLFFSPYSISMALAMACAGAQGATDSQIRQALSVTLSGDDYHAATNALDLALMKSSQGITLNVVNSAWCQSGWDFRIAYLDKISRYYGAGVNLLDFATRPDESRSVINTWVGNQTNQKILNLLPQGSITDLTRLVLTNAIYFLGTWQHQFDKSLTKNAPFYLSTTGSVTTPLMQLGKDRKSVV